MVGPANGAELVKQDNRFGGDPHLGQGSAHVGHELGRA